MPLQSGGKIVANFFKKIDIVTASAGYDCILLKKEILVTATRSVANLVIKFCHRAVEKVVANLPRLY